MATVKLFYENAFTRAFDAAVLSCEARADGWAVALDRTAFNPEGGGQAGDTGVLGPVRVTDTHEKGGVILHYTDGPLAHGTAVHGELDWAERFRKMQNHSGEHIVSGLVHGRYGYDNVGFHLGDDGCTLDFSGELTREELDGIERAANEVVWKNVPVTARFPAPEELRSMDYRSKLDLTENVRIVTVEGVDVCACCAPHVERTGQIGVIKLLDFMRHRGGVRVWLKAGSDALRDFDARYRDTAALSALLNVPQGDIVPAAEKLLSSRDELKFQLTALRRQAIEARAAAIQPTDGSLLLFAEGEDADLRVLVNAGMEKCGGVCAVFSGEDGAYRFVMGSRSRDMRAFAKDIREPLAARGGGQERMISGRSAADRTTLEAFFAALT